MIERGRRLPFVVLPWAVLDDENLSSNDVLVYATISRFADNRTGVAYPSRLTIARLSRCSESTVDRCVQRLVDAGLIEKQTRRTAKGDPDTNLYVVHEVAAQGVASPVKPRPRTREGRGGVTGDDRTRTNLTRTPYPHADVEPHDPAEWTLPPPEIKARLAPLVQETTE